MSNVYNATIRNARMQAVITEAGANAIVRAYNGARPPSGGAITGGNNLIGSLTCGAALGTVAAGVLTFAAITGDASADANGTPTFLRVVKSDGATFVADFDCPGFPACTLGQPIDITSWTVTEGNAT
jgi:hypothetical protein